ncbi:MAG: FAD binding domain-containing protein [Methylobacteriaceae bacterium]|nr:FAD binding domain-containing protein [Methylobacteriaceae bacterium]
MKPAPFTYRAASSSPEAIDALAKEAPPRILAGGQSLVPMLNLRLAPADALLDITRIAELRAVEETINSVRYGALTTHASFEDGLVPDASNGLMSHAAGNIAYRAVRTRGTIGGAIALADPAADWVTVCIALEAVLHLQSTSGKRQMQVEEFVLGPYFTAIAEGELISTIEVPKRSASERWGYHKVVVKTGEYAESMAVALLDRARGFARIVLGATDGAPIVMKKSAGALLAAADEAALKTAIACDLEAGEHEFGAAKRMLHTTAVLRAAKDAMAS